MGAIHVLPVHGDVFVDARDDGRAMRLSWRNDGDLAVLSIWRAATCVATFQVARHEVPALVEALTRGLAAN